MIWLSTEVQIKFEPTEIKIGRPDQCLKQWRNILFQLMLSKPAVVNDAISVIGMVFILGRNVQIVGKEVADDSKATIFQWFCKWN